MNILNEAYLKCVTENERNLRFWEEYVNNLKSLDFSIYSDKLTVPILVPIGNRIFFRGELKHTNEVTVALGADYFAKCSLKQAEILRKHRLKDAESKLEVYKKEKEYLEQQLSFSKENVYENLGQEIVEVYSEEEDKVWREKHRENMRRYKLESKAEAETTVSKEVTDEELWNRLEELELQEELENELSIMNEPESTTQKNIENTFIVKVPDVPTKTTDKDILNSTQKSKEIQPPPQTPKLDLLQQVLEKQQELEQKLQDLKNKERSQTRTEQELIDRLDEMEELEELEDEMERLEDILETEDIESTDEDSISRQSSTKRGVTFADEDDSETLEIVFKHSAVEPSHEPYNPDKGITKPSDIYDAYSNLFTETTSILKKTKYENSKGEGYLKKTKENNLESNEIISESNDEVINKTIVVKDVIEKIDVNENKLENGARPTSLFKKKRLQKK